MPRLDVADSRSRISAEKAVHVTDCNAAFFDTANEFAGCIAVCHEVLRRQGLFEGLVPGCS